VIPPFETDPGEDGRHQLPPGIHVATWPGLVERFGNNERRREIVAGLLRALQALKAAGCRRAYIDGSFVTSKDEPGDFDGCWDHAGVDFDVLDPVLLDFEGHREAQKAKFDGEMFIADAPGSQFLEFFQIDRDGRPKGIIQINLADIPS
jgi:hypothetical protein